MPHGGHCEHGALAVDLRMPKQALGGDKSFKLMAAHPTDALLWGNTSSPRPSHLCSSLQPTAIILSHHAIFPHPVFFLPPTHFFLNPLPNTCALSIPARLALAAPQMCWKGAFSLR